jgi:tRNA (adenine37-N6)-methyltransferase
VIYTPWKGGRLEVPEAGCLSGPFGALVIDERWQVGLAGISRHRCIQVLYWINQARRCLGLVLQTPFQRETSGTFALHSPVRPNPIASSRADLVIVAGNTLRVRGLDCLRR